MNRLDMKGSLCEKWINSFSPSCNEIFHINKEIAIGERFKKNYVKTITQTGTFILNHQESKYRICGSVPESITKY